MKDITLDQATFSRKKAIALVEEIEPRFSQIVRYILQDFPYRTPKGFVKWEEIAKMLAFYCQMMHDESFKHQDVATTAQTYLALKWMQEKGPLYAISNELMKAFLATEILNKAGVLSNIPVVTPTLMLLIPDNALPSPEGGSIDHLVIGFREHSKLSQVEREAFNKQKYDFDFDKILFVGCCDTKQTVWFSNIGINKAGKVYFDKSRSLGASALSPQDGKFTEDLRSLALQVLLAIAYTPDLLSEGGESSSKPHSKSHNKEKQTLYPRWLGKNYKRPEGYRVRSLQGTHSSPRAHWRKAHPRWQPCGKGRQERKYVWIEPIKVNFEK